MSRSGSCQCGQVSYVVAGEPLFTYACHCHSCQKRTGSAFSLGAVFPEASLTVSGTLARFSRSSDSGHINTRYSCAECGNVIYGDGTATPGVIKLQPGTLEDTREVAPDVHIWTCQAQPWFVFPEQSVCFATQPDDLSQLLKT